MGPFKIDVTVKGALSVCDSSNIIFLFECIFITRGKEGVQKSLKTVTSLMDGPYTKLFYFHVNLLRNNRNWRKPFQCAPSSITSSPISLLFSNWFLSLGIFVFVWNKIALADSCCRLHCKLPLAAFASPKPGVVTNDATIPWKILVVNRQAAIMFLYI